MPVLTVGKLRLDPAARTVAYGDTPIELTRKEFALLEALMRRPVEAVSRFDLLMRLGRQLRQSIQHRRRLHRLLEAKGGSAVWHREHRDRTRLRLPAPYRGDRMNRLPIRWKLTLAFALALTTVLTAVGIFLHFQLSSEWTMTSSAISARAPPSSVDCSCASRYRRCPPQLLSSWNRMKRSRRSSRRQAVWSLPPPTPTSRLLTPEQLRDAAVGELFVNRPGDTTSRRVAQDLRDAMHARGENFVVVVTDSLDERSQTLASTLGVEIVGLAAALMASCGRATGCLGLLRPVEETRPRAAAISAD